ncbi:MAG: peptidase T [Coriobacteriia bacterium]|nr:peptidase T [Coriobacteriia bacterium]
MSDVVDRLIRYAKVGTPSNPANEAQVPSNPEELDLARLLADELRALGIEDASCDEHAYVIGHVPASAGAEDLPCLGLLAHIDASPDAPAHGVEPRIVHYEGGELTLGVVDGEPITLNAENTPDLPKLVGKDLICTDGSTLLAADDKAGVAEIMALVARIVADPSIPHPRLAVCFAPDEEIGHGCSLLDLDKFGADYAYTIDGADIGGVEYECFNAASVDVEIRGHEIHPGSAKDIMINSLHIFEEFDAMLPAWERPEHTDGYEGFFHLASVQGTCVHTSATYIIRDHDAKRFEAKKQLVVDAGNLLNKRWDEPRVTVTVRDQYRNMAEVVAPHMHLIDNANEAFRSCGYEPYTLPIRGGTDGSQLSFRGLPCPNLSTGGYNFHSVREFIPVFALEGMVDVLQALAGRYAVAQN